MRMGGLLFGEESLAGFGATTTDLGADAAMFQLRAMFFALRATTLARFQAGAKLGARQFEIGPGKARDNASGSEADIRAVDAMADASNHLGDILLSETGVGASIASFGAGITGGDAFDAYRVVRRRIDRV